MGCLRIKYHHKSDLRVSYSNKELTSEKSKNKARRYTPFGETFVDLRSETFATPYRFTGKEQDAETGLYYYGARYYDARLGRFLSVDPLADQGPGISPYAYSFNNPINFYDPDGRWPWPKGSNLLKKGVTWFKEKVDIKFSAKLTLGYQIGLKNNFVELNAKKVTEVVEINLSSQNGAEFDYLLKNGEVEVTSGGGVGIGLDLTGEDPVGIGISSETNYTEYHDQNCSGGPEVCITEGEKTRINEVSTPSGAQTSYDSDGKVGGEFKQEVNLILIGIEVSGGIEIDTNNE